MGGTSAAVTIKKGKKAKEESLPSCVECPGNPSAASLAMQNGDLGYGKRRCGFNRKHQSTEGIVQGYLSHRLPPPLRLS